MENKIIFNKEEMVQELSKLAQMFKQLYGQELNPVFSEISKMLENAQYKIMQNL
jgi:hypothetical protein